MSENKPILLTHEYKDGTIWTVVWHPFWGEKPDLGQAKAEGKLLETDKHYQIITKDE